MVAVPDSVAEFIDSLCHIIEVRLGQIDGLVFHLGAHTSSYE